MTEQITIHGGLTAIPELRYSAQGVPIVSGTIASTERYKDKDGEWRDGRKLFLRYSGFREVAENIAASNLDKGTQVVVTGKLLTREFEDGEGVKRTSTELEVIDFAVSLRRATAQVTRTGGRTGAESRSTPQTGTWSTPTEMGPQTGVQGFDTEVPF